MAEINQGEKATYESPQAMRLQGQSQALGVCDDGSGDASCITPGTTATLGDCIISGVSAQAGSCQVSGVTAGGGNCDASGVTPGGACASAGVSVS